jgi:tRNA dimethylallyltransferase
MNLIVNLSGLYKMKLVLFLVGPTAIGKTDLSLLIARQLAVEIVSADARQVYRLLDIGTAKPMKDILDSVPHHLINFLRPEEYFSAGSYARIARKIIEQIFKRQKVPLVVGGSGLYIKSLIDGIVDLEIRDEKIRSSLRQRLLREGIGNLYADLQEKDPQLAVKLSPNDKQRIIRGLEVVLSTGKKLSDLLEAPTTVADFTPLMFGLTANREWLYQRVNARVERMFEQGFLSEVANLKMHGYTPSLNPLNSVGYKEVFEYLNNRLTYDQMLELIKKNTRHYAKRQLTWFRKDQRINWIEIGQNSDLENIAKGIVEKYKQQLQNAKG